MDLRRQIEASRAAVQGKIDSLLSRQKDLESEETVSKLIYVPQFLSEEEAQKLFETGVTLPFKRKTVMFGKLARHASYEFTTFPSAENHRPLSGAPAAILHLRDRLSEYAGRDVNNLSVVRYETGDYFDWHQHRADKVRNEDGTKRDATVYIVSTGVVRPFSVRPVGGKREDILAEHGSLIVLPASFNRTHEHSVPKVKATGVRIAVNAQSRKEAY